MITSSLQFPPVNHAGKMLYKNGLEANYSSIRVENNRFYHHTGKGLKEMFPSNPDIGQKMLADELNKKTEPELIESRHIMCPFIDQIEKFIV
ncbi:MAG TPA: hypothetical protein VNZ45_02765 [Bacteroidia bacterium]|jgi:hypothetical protein|nr:hypothetical protein [Bacteroidia bacterium]